LKRAKGSGIMRYNKEKRGPLGKKGPKTKKEL